MKRIIGDHSVDIDLDRILEALEQHLKDVSGAIDSIRRIKAWSTPPEIAGVKTVCNLGNTLDPTGVASSQPLWANAYAILHAAARRRACHDGE